MKSASTTSQVSNGSVICAAKCSAHWWWASPRLPNATRNPLSAMPFKRARSLYGWKGFSILSRFPQGA